MIGDLLRAPIVGAEAFGDPAGPHELFAEETAVLTRAVDKRRREFATVRACARSALRQLGVDPVPILPGESGAPRWPSGVVGSMTHCRGYRAAALARTDDLATIGLDAESNRPLPNAGMAELVLLADERAELSELAARRPDVCWDRLLFSAKESVYKAWFPLTRRWLGLEDTEVRVDPDGGTFTARFLLPGPVVDGVQLAGFEGGWLVRDGFIVTAVAVFRSGSGGIPEEVLGAGT